MMQKESLQEAERLAYVAMTRARDHLIIIWARAQKQDNNPLVSLLFGPNNINKELSSLTSKYLKEWLNKKELGENITYVKSNQHFEKWILENPEQWLWPHRRWGKKKNF